jgi:exopolysaccharide biosynthesis polyprenyl glycosylphosphotransferase
MTVPARGQRERTRSDLPASVLVDAPDDHAALMSPSWPLHLSVGAPLFVALCGALAAPVLLAQPGEIVGLALPVPLLGVALATRLAFQTLSTRRGAGRLPTAEAAIVGAGGAAAVAALGAGLAVHAALVAVAASAVTIAALLILASALRRLELRRGAQNRRVFFIGSASQYLDLAREVGRRGDLCLVGHALTEKTADGDLLRAIADARPTTLVLSAEATRDEDLVSAASQLHLGGLRVRALDDFYERQFAKVPLSELSQAWFLFDVAEIHRPRIYGALKRWIESAVAACLLLLSLPWWPAIAVAVKLSSRGPVFYRQRRVGRDGRGFWLTKFRTMRQPDGDAAPRWATEDRLRITPVGRLLRRFRLDELPQLWRIVRGDLALVGPRPEQPEIVERLQRSIDFYGARHCVRPGLTGWAQVNYGYGGSQRGVLEKLQYDFFYIRHQSLRLDLLILLATVRTVLLGEGR